MMILSRFRIESSMAIEPTTRESYRGYKPPCNVAKTIELLLRYVPPSDLRGFGGIVLTNASGLSRSQRHRRTAAGSHFSDVNGLYHQGSEGQKAYVEIFVDNIFKGWPVPIARLPFVRAIILSEVLYHELGHHVQSISKIRSSNREHFAESWELKAARRFMREHYWYLRPVFWVSRLLGAGKGTKLLFLGFLGPASWA